MARGIVIHGARVHNLKNIDLEIPRDRLVVITGVSGSGKSSLAFDTLYAEGQRRYLESLAADARQFLRQIEKPDVDGIEGLSPAVALTQSSVFYTSRSTVGTITEIYDYLRLLFARAGQPSCPRCGADIAAYTFDQIADRLAALPAQTRLLVLAPITAANPAERRQRLSELARDGFARIKIGTEMRELSDEEVFTAAPVLPSDLVVDRLVIREGMEKRLWDSLETAARYGGEVVKIEARSANELPKEMVFSLRNACIRCGTTLPEITPSLFSFNSPQGACPACGGTGIAAVSVKAGEDSGLGEPCAVCAATRLKKESLAVKLGQLNIAQVAALAAPQALEFFATVELGERQSVIARKVLGEISSRLRFLIQVGLNYLSLDRSSLTLSGGEAQRVRLATQIGAKLAGVLYILDEPTIGLHPRDTGRLIMLLEQLRDAGNSVIVVEHDREMILNADHVIDMGPGAGVQGGRIVAQGTPAGLRRDEGSLTGRYLSGAIAITMPGARRHGTGNLLVIKGAREHNLKNITVEIPVGAMTCVTGVSGSGKSSLIIDILYHSAARRFYRSKVRAGAHDEITGWEHFDRVIGIDQAPIGRTPRSNPATYTGIFDQLRGLYARLPEARLRGYKAGRFSFNAKGGRCEACAGDGVIKVDMYFLPPVLVTCDVCKGRRYNRETLAVKYRGLSIADALDLTVNQAAELFSSIPGIFERLRVLREVGLGYLTLGQPAASLSGGEAQRVKLARELARKSTGRSLYILDEPTSGLHFDDISKLLEVLHRLTDEGNTMVVVEHDLDVIKSADYVIDLGPEGGDKGGCVIAHGTPENVAQTPASVTGGFLQQVIEQP
ncbi:MAG: excinuclease ABC subunit UvrA [Candidatus Binatia bacterium]